MIKSMTGFGRAEAVSRERKVSVELKSVNHRYLDLSIKMPRKLGFLEGAIRNLMKTYMQRGKVDVFITYEDYTLSCGALKYNKELASEYMAYIRQMAEEFGIENDVKAGALSHYPDVLTMEEQSVDEEELWAVLEGPLREACEKFAQAREREGEHLKNDLITKLEALDEKVNQVEEQEGIGRKLDFMAQEMNREANTILSKSSDLVISNIAIDLKTEIEKIREQIQNIE